MSHAARELRIQSSQLLEHKTIKTTYPKAVRVRQYVERALHQAVKAGMPAKRAMLKNFFGNKAVNQALDLTRGAKIKLHRLGVRRGDNALIAQIKIEQLTTVKNGK